MSYKKICQHCGKTFMTERYTAKYCCQSCYYKQKRADANQARLDEVLEKEPDCGAYLKDGHVYYRRRCLYCGREFSSLNPASKYCSKRCHDADSNFRKRRKMRESRQAKAMADIDYPMKGRELQFKKVCAYCGQEFLAMRRTTMFCSSACAKKYRRRQSEEERDIPVTPGNVDRSLRRDPVNTGPYLHLSEAMELLCISRSTLYRYIRKGVVDTISLPGVVLVTRESIESLHSVERRFYVKKGAADNAPPEFKPNPVISAGDRWISISEACKLYNLDQTKAQFMIRRSGLEFQRFRNIRFYDRQELHRFLTAKIRASHPEITEWYTVDEIMEMTGRTRVAVYQMVFAHQEIPRRKDKGKTYYAKEQVDAAIEEGEGVDYSVQFYSVEEAVKRYRLTKDKLYKLVRRKGLRKVNVRGKLWIRREDLDSLMELNGPDGPHPGNFF